MPYARKPKRASRPRRRPSGVRKRTYKKRTVFRPQRLLRVGFPKTNMVKLRYVESVSFDPGLGTLGQYIFSANNVFDPNVTGIGHQPMCYDQWAALYNHYVVVGSKIKAQFFYGSNVTTNTEGFLCGINLQDDASLSTDPSTVMEQGLSKYRFGAAIGTTNASRGIMVTKGFSAKKFFNITNPTDNYSRIGAGVGSSPTETANFIVFAGTPATDDLPFVKLTVIIEYIVIFSEPKGQSQS